MKQIIFLSMLMCVLPLAVFAMTCNSETLADGSNDISGPSALDNGTIDNCVDADVAAWAISKVYLYTDAFCTTGKQEITILGDTVTSPGEANKVNFFGTPDLGSATIANGTYNCVATKMWDNITFSPATTTTTASCTAADNYTQDICASDNASSLTMVYNPDNSSSYSCSLDATGSNEWIWVYFSTSSTDSDNMTLVDLENDYHPPTADNLSNGIPLGAALVVSSSSSGNLKTTLTSRIADTGDGCEMLKPAFSFE
jgi:hypothetical protein